MPAFRILGPLGVDGDGRAAALGGPRERALLAALLVRPNRAVAADRLVEELWEGEPPDSGAASLRVVVSRVRKSLAEVGVDERLVTRSPGYVLEVADDELDSLRFESLASRGRGALEAGDPRTAADLLREALALWRGEALEEFADRSFAQVEVARLGEARLAVIEDRMDAELACGRASSAIGELEALTATHPLRERLWEQRMVALYRCGRQAEALRVFQDVRRVLGDELGLDPSPRLIELEQGIARHALEPAVSVPSGGRPERRRLPSGVVTMLLTDIEGSTPLWDTEPAAMAAAMVRHDALFADIVAAHHGALLRARGEGDSVFSVFGRASDAASAALAAQRALADEAWPGGIELRVRMALHTGETIEGDGDYQGAAVNRAARLRGLAAGGEIIVSQSTADLIVDHLEDGTLVEVGERYLRGLSRPERVFLLRAEGGEEAAASGALDAPLMAPLPTPVSAAAAGFFVSRAPELAQLDEVWRTVKDGQRHAVLVAGEPGVGKTRLVSEFAARVHADGAAVLFGRCDEDLGVPFQPFAEAVRDYTAAWPTGRLAEYRTRRGTELFRLVPEAGRGLEHVPEPSASDPESDRLRLFDALAAFLADVAARAPVLLVLDDLQWAAKPTLLLLRHLLRTVDETPLMIVATYRDTDVDRTHPLSHMLADLRRERNIARLVLRGLDESGVGAFIAAAGRQELGERERPLARALYQQTDGNPFFVNEVLRHLVETGAIYRAEGRWESKLTGADDAALPEGVRDVIGRRVGRLSAAANKMLTVASVVGQDFSVELLETIPEAGDPDGLLDAFDEAVRAGIIVERSGAHSFAHALVRQTLYSELGITRRARLHQRIASAIEAGGDGVIEAHLADLARHWFECALGGGAAKAVDYSRRAGDQAIARLAYEEAADLFDRAIQAADMDDSGSSPDQRAELLRAQCEALLAGADLTAAADAVAQLRQSSRDRPRLEAWATCYTGQLAVLTHPERLDATAADVARAAAEFASLAEAEGEAAAHTVRAACLARTGRIAESEAALDLALTAARRASSPRRVNAVLAGAPIAALWGPSPVARASGRCLDVVRVLRITTGSPVVEAVALRCQSVLEALRGRHDAARRMLASARRLLEELGHTHQLFEVDLFGGLVELYSDSPASAEPLLRRAFDGFAARGVGVDAALAAALLARCHIAAGGIDEALALTERAEDLAGADLHAAIAWRAARAEALTALGRVEDALEFAGAAVALAEPTDALLDLADAHVSMSVVLRATGDEVRAQREAAVALELYERKGATARAEAIGGSSLSNVAVSDVARPVARRRVRPNAVTAVLRSGPVDDAFIAEWTAALAPEFVGVDHRMNVRGMTGDAQDLMTILRQMSSGRDPVLSLEPIATLGERCCLTRSDWRTGRGLHQLTFLTVVGVDSEARLTALESFEEADLNLACARLIELHAETELPPERRSARQATVSLFRDKRLGLTDDAVIVDHRPVSFGTLSGRDAVRAAGHAFDELSAGHDLRLRDVLGFTESVLLVEMITEGAAADGGSFEIVTLNVVCFADSGLIDRLEWCLPEQLDEALARFDGLAKGQPNRARRLRPNAASDLMAGLAGPLSESRIDAWTALLADGFLDVDHRMQLAVGAEGLVASLRAIAAAGDVVQTVEVIATLGERHALSRNSVHLNGGLHVVSFLTVLGVDAVGRAVRIEQFGDAQLNLALARLVELHADYELPAEQRDGRYRFAALSRGVRTEWTADAVLVDHRLASLGTLRGRDAIASAAASWREVAGALPRRITDVLGLTASVVLLDGVNEGEVDGGAVEMPLLALGVVTDVGAFSRQEWYLPEQLEEALARFDELVVESAPEVTASRRNAAVRAIERAVQLFERRDWDALAALVVAGPIIDSRRRILGGFNIGFLESFQSIAKAGASVLQVDGVETRGERLALARIRAVGSGAFEEALGVIEVDDRGIIVRSIVFDPEDEALARAELDAWAAATPIPRHLNNSAVRFVGQAFALGLAGKWDEYAALISSETVTVDRRRLVGGFSVQGIESNLEYARSIVKAGATSVVTTPIATRGDRLALVRTLFVGESAEAEGLVLAAVDEEGKGLGGALFDADDLDAAFTELDARYVAGGGVESGRQVLAWWNDFNAAYHARDWVTLTSLYPADLVIDDHRPMGWGTVDRTQWIKSLQAMVELVPDLKIRVISIVRIGGSIALCVAQATGHQGAGGEVELPYLVLAVLEGDSLGHGEFFALDDLAAAVERFDQLKRR